MGKSQKKRMMRRHNPMRVPDSHLPHGLASAESASTKKEAILPIIRKVCLLCKRLFIWFSNAVQMESPDVSERKWACVAVSNLIQNDPSTRRLLQGKNVVGALITRLSDSEEEVWIEAAGALRFVRSGFLGRSLTLHTLEICASMGDMTFARRCTTKISLPP